MRPVGMVSIASRLSTWVCTAVVTSTIGASPVTVIDSSSAPTLMSALIVIVNSDGSSMPSRRTVGNPVSVKVTE